MKYHLAHRYEEWEATLNTQSDSVTLRLFGMPRASRDGRPVTFDTRKALALLAYLAVTGTEHGRQSLAFTFWPELDGTRARAALRRTLSVAAAVGPGLIITTSTVALNLSMLECDVREFRRLAGADDAADQQRALDLTGDGFLAGFSLRDSAVFEDWQLATAESLRDELSQLLARMVARNVGGGNLPAALGFAQHRLHIDPLSEPAHTDLIRVLAWMGDRPTALGAYRALVRLLDRELGVAPLPQTLALHDEIRGDRLPPPVSSHGNVPAAPPPSRPAIRLIGRDAELAALNAALHNMKGPGRPIGLVGEPGVGKTALASAIAQRCTDEGGVALTIAGHAAERQLAFATATDLVRGLLAIRPGLGRQLGPSLGPLAALSPSLDRDGDSVIRNPGDLQRLHEAVRVAIGAVAHENQLLLIVDDAHELDAPSAGLLGYVARRPPPGTIVLVTWVRGSGAAQLPTAVIEAGTVIPVGSLDMAAVTEMLGDSTMDATEVMRRTRGIPLLVQEYAAIAGALDDLTSVTEATGVRELVAARLDAAPELTRQLVAAAAVIATVADPELLRSACGRDEAETVDAIEDAISRGLLVERTDRPGYDVPHDLVRDLALAGLSFARRRLLHGRVADVLARRHPVDPLAAPAGTIARHLANAGRDEEAGAWFLRAAHASTRLFAHAEALEQLDAAQALGHSPIDVHEARGAALVRLGRYTESLVALDQAAALAEDSPPRLAAIEHAIAGVQDRLGDWGLARAHLEASLELVAGNAPERRARILADLALVSHRMGRPVDAARLAEEAMKAASSAGDRAALAQATNVLGVVELARGEPTALDRFVHAVELSREIDDLDLEIAALNNLSRAADAIGDSEAAMGYARRALAGAEQQGDRHRLAVLHSHMADLLHAAGKDDEAMAQLRSSAVAFAEVQDATIRPEVWTLTEW